MADGLVAPLRAAGCVFAEDEARLLVEAAGDAGDAADPDALEAMVGRRVAGEPLELVLGWVEFDGLRLQVAPGVFVPRQGTVAMVDEAVALLAGIERPRVVDLCCGVGAVGCAVVRRVPDADVALSDVDATAVRLARANLDAHGGAGADERERVAVAGDLFSGLPEGWRGQVDVCTANAPYVPSRAVAFMPRESRDHEPLATVDGGEDGLAVHRRLAAVAGEWLRPGGHLLVEVSPDQVDGALTLLAERGLAVRAVASTDDGPVVVVATTPFDPAPPRLGP
ncbi:methylase [Nocardioides daphniae]|uniref:Methylase n=1 Tax=Nocardioides daphniae TaxID=402297 RepID=A0A4P7UK21_9ACTN|nr:putative protein N(5)-glutamine methyltransferase [Nocardioides daphniae]GGD14816.1 methylase [Nocardioides daphniae]